MLSRLKLSLRIYIGFGVLVAIGLTGAVAGVQGLRSVGTQSDLTTQVSATLGQTAETAKSLEAVRRALLRYRLDRSAAARVEQAKTEAQTLVLLNRLAQEAYAPQDRPVYAGLVQTFSGLDATIARFYALRDNAAKAQEALLVRGEQMTEGVQRLLDLGRATSDPATVLAAAEAESAILLVRVANLRFQTTLDPAGPETVRRNADNAAAAVRRLADAIPPVASATGQVLATLADYRSDFTTFAENVLQETDLYEGKLLPTIAAMQTQLAALEAVQNRTFDQMRQASAVVINRTATLQSGLAVTVLVLGAVIAVLIGRSIVGPMAAMTAAMSGLAAGDTASPIPGRDNRDEVGDMARAVEVFRRNAIAAGALAAEQDSARAAKERRAARIADLVQGFEQQVGALASELSTASTALDTSDVFPYAAREHARTPSKEWDSPSDNVTVTTEGAPRRPDKGATGERARLSGDHPCRAQAFKSL